MKKNQNKNKTFNFNDQDTHDMQQFVDILSFFNDATNKLSGESYATASLVIPWLQAFRNKLTVYESRNEKKWKTWIKYGYTVWDRRNALSPLKIDDGSSSLWKNFKKINQKYIESQKN